MVYHAENADARFAWKDALVNQGYTQQGEGSYTPEQLALLVPRNTTSFIINITDNRTGAADCYLPAYVAIDTLTLSDEITTTISCNLSAHIQSCDTSISTLSGSYDTLEIKIHDIETNISALSTLSTLSNNIKITDEAIEISSNSRHQIIHVKDDDFIAIGNTLSNENYEDETNIKVGDNIINVKYGFGTNLSASDGLNDSVLIGENLTVKHGGIAIGKNSTANYGGIAIGCNTTNDFWGEEGGIVIGNNSRSLDRSVVVGNESGIDEERQKTYSQRYTIFGSKNQLYGAKYKSVIVGQTNEIGESVNGADITLGNDNINLSCGQSITIGNSNTIKNGSKCFINGNDVELTSCNNVIAVGSNIEGENLTSVVAIGSDIELNNLSASVVLKIGSKQIVFTEAMLEKLSALACS